MTIPFEVFKAEMLADPEVKREYDALAPEFEALAKSLAAKQAEATKSPASRRILKTQPNLAPQRRRNIHQGIERKSRNSPAQQIVDPWLSNSAPLSRFLLRPTVLLDDRLDLVHQVGAQRQVS
jgi:hypothetical protein